MRAVIEIMFWLFCIGIAIGCVMSVMWFCLVAAVDLYKNYLEKNSKL